MAEFVNNRAEFQRAKDQAVAAALEAIGNQCVTHAKQIVTAGVPRNAKSWYTPTGDLRKKITHKVRMNEEAVYVGTNVKYAIYNEFGTGIYAADGKGRKSPWAYKGSDGKKHWTRGMKPLHFLRNALQDHKDEYKAIAEKYLKNG